MSTYRECTVRYCDRVYIYIYLMLARDKQVNIDHQYVVVEKNLGIIYIIDYILVHITIQHYRNI